MHHLHREKLYSLFDDKVGSVVYLQGADTLYRDHTDFEFPFRQESNFLYLTGADEPGCALLLDIEKEEYHLFVPKRDSFYAVWHGYVKTLDAYKKEFKPDHIHYINDLNGVIEALKPETIFCLSEAQSSFFEASDHEYNLDTKTLLDAITHCRLLKTGWELDQMRFAARINNEAHKAAAKSINPDVYEYEVKAALEAVQVNRGLTQPAYNGIYASGKNSAILHYVYNHNQAKDGELFLIDAGFEYQGYASDYSRTYPVNGRFSPIQAGVYQAVLDALNQAIAEIKPGKKMSDLHLMAARTMMQGMIDMNLLQGEADELVENEIFKLFYPHKLGHYLGLDTHDVGNYAEDVERINRKGIKPLYPARELQEGMVITVEPGLYFIPALLEPAFEDPKKSPFLNISRLSSLLNFGGVRIEDNLIITASGHENLTDVPKEVLDVEKLMNE